MNKLAAITILVCVFSVIANDQEDFFDSIAQNEFGRTVIETLQLELGQDNPISKGVNLLRQMQSSAVQDQQEASKKIQARQEFCTTRLDEVDVAIRFSEIRRAEDEQQVPLKLEEIQDKLKQLDDKKGEEQRNLDRIATLVSERKESKAEFDQKRVELIGLIVALQQGKKLISQLKSGFLQINEDVLAEISDHHKSFMRRFPNKRGYNSIVSLIMETAQDANIRTDQNLVKTILTAIDDMVDSLYAVQKQELLADDSRELAFQKAKARFESDNTHLKQALATLDAQVQNLSQKLLELNNDIATHTQLIDTKTIQKSDWQKTCMDERRAYETQTANRDDQLRILDQSVNIFSSGITEEARKHLCQIQV